MGIFLTPAVAPLAMAEMGLSGLVSGLILTLPAAATALVIPVLNRYIPWAGLEETILQSNIGFSLSCAVLGFGLSAQKASTLMGVTVAGGLVFGIMFAANITAETVLLLKYSPKQDRERNIGIFRAATGLGSAVSPLLISVTLLLVDDYWGCYVCVAAGLLIATPFIHSGLTKARDIFKEEFLKSMQKDDDDV